VWNNAKTIQNAIDSVISQTHKNIEYIVIDGASTDGTVEIVRMYGENISKFVSEADKGLYDAMNKGIALVSGDLVGILNSDDFYAYSDAIKDVVTVFESDANVGIVYGDLLYVDAQDVSKTVRTWESGEYRAGLFESGWHPPHPSFFVRKKVYDEFGLFNTGLKIAADYELMLRLMHKYSVKAAYIPKVFVKMRTGGASNGSIFGIVKANIECLRAWNINGFGIRPMIFFKKPISKIKQLFKGRK
ncbi:MAG TPA: glycosyltransferase family 2 protein, partial [Campylobacterales bacterium]|nr:glycosyltransferase family 2 protein [Campylobacterales bacterium]